MGKLENIEKKDIFKVPEGYFETLPTIIQSRVAQDVPTKSYLWLFASLKYALPALLLVVSVTWYLNRTPEYTPDEMLAMVSTEDIADYLNSMELANDEFLEMLDYSMINVDSLDLQESHLDIDDDLLDEILIEMEPRTELQ